MGMGLMGPNPTDSPTLSAIYGGLAAPVQIGHTFRRSLDTGRGTPTDMINAATDQIPILGDARRATLSPDYFLGKMAQRFLPPALMAIGDKTVRDPRGESLLDIEGYLQERLPWERTSLPAKPNYFGEEEQRNWFGGLPELLNATDPRAAALAEMGLYRNQQSGQMGDAQLTKPEENELKAMRGQRMMDVMDPILANRSALAGFPDVVAALPPDQQQLVEELIATNGVPRSDADLMRIYQALGINLGTQEFKGLRLARMLQQQGGR